MKEVKTKICTKCKIEQNVSCFHKDKKNKDGLDYWCKLCKKQRYRNKRGHILKQQKVYQKINVKQRATYQKQYCKDNVEDKKQYDIQYRECHMKQRSDYNKKHDKDLALFENYSKKLEMFEKIRRYSGNSELLEVKCAYCGKWVIPINSQVGRRVRVFNGTISGEHHFYCSENCKQSCPIFNQKVWPKGFKKATSREVVPLLRQLVLKRDNYACQKCGATTETAQLHVHHEKSYTLNKIMANDPDNCITLCKKCHQQVHSQEGCRTVDLRCSKDNKSE